jgi:hypothetical protein
VVQQPQRGQGGRNAARAQQAHHAPGHQALARQLTVPPILVKAANSRSVPMARWGLTPKKKISTGVISEPPPTPVSPTMRPTAKPAKTNAKSCGMAYIRDYL